MYQETPSSAHNKTVRNISKYIVAYSGAHGTGKTTSVHRYAENYRGYSKVSIVPEAARDCPYAVLSKTTRSSRKAQEWIFVTQNLREVTAIQANDIVVCDRTLVDCIAYTVHAGYDDLADAMREYARKVVAKRYTKIYFKLLRNNNYVVDDGFRDHNLATARAIEEIMISEYERLKLPAGLLEYI